MNTKLFTVCLAAGFLAFPALAQVSTPPAEVASTASTATETSGGGSQPLAATDLALGAQVFDTVGAKVGEISRVTPGATMADTMVMLSVEGRSVEIAAASLALQDGAIVSSQTKADIWKPQ